MINAMDLRMIDIPRSFLIGAITIKRRQAGYIMQKGKQKRANEVATQI